jgi:hypothetical protein
VTNIDFAYFNYEHGGRRNADYTGEGGAYDFAPLCRVIGHEGRWPDVLIMGEADRYEYEGGAGLWGAAAAMRAAGGRNYTPLACSLPREWGPFAPAYFIDTQTVQIWRYFHHGLPDFAARTRNLLRARIPGREDIFHILTGHGDLSGGEQRLADAKNMRRFGYPEFPTVIGEDWNSTPSGPHWAVQDLNDRRRWPHYWMIANRALWRHGRRQAGPYRADTRDLDYLCGSWRSTWREHLANVLTHRGPWPRGRGGAWPRGRHVGGVGFHWVGELVHDNTPTNLAKPNGRQRSQLDGFVVNDLMKDLIVPDSFLVQDHLDPDHPDSDHLVVRVAFNI